MSWKLEEAVLVRGGERCEDRLGLARDYAWVIDGATSIGPSLFKQELSDVEWLVEELEFHIRRVIIENKGLHPVEVLSLAEAAASAVVRDIIDPSGIPSVALPTASVALIRRVADKLEYTLVGDCSLIFRKKNENVVCITDGRAAELEAPILQRFIELSKLGAPRLEMEQALYPLVLNMRERLNQDGGYAAIDLLARGSSHSVVGLVDIIEGDVIISSDGLLRILDVFKALDLDAFFDLCNTSLLRAVDVVRQLENQDPRHIKGPRLKARDDVGAIRLSILPH